MRIGLIGGGVCGVDVDEELLGVPVEERAQVGVQVEPELRILLALGRVIMRAAFDAAFCNMLVPYTSGSSMGGKLIAVHLHLNVLQLHGGIGVLCREEKDRDSGKCADNQRNRGEKAEYRLDAG